MRGQGDHRSSILYSLLHDWLYNVPKGATRNKQERWVGLPGYASMFNRGYINL